MCQRHFFAVLWKVIYLGRLKKLVTITLLVIHLFNVAGYNLLFQYFINKSETRLIRQLDSNTYDEAALLVLKVPMNLPYYTSSSAAERVDGEIEISGIHYNYVKRRVLNDTLYLYCIPNTDKTKLSRAQNEFSKQASDAPPDNKKGGNALVKKMKWGVEYRLSFFHFDCSGSANGANIRTGFVLQALTFPTFASPYKPPEVA